VSKGQSMLGFIGIDSISHGDASEDQ